MASHIYYYTHWIKFSCDIHKTRGKLLYDMELTKGSGIQYLILLLLQ